MLVLQWCLLIQRIGVMMAGSVHSTAPAHASRAKDRLGKLMLHDG